MQKKEIFMQISHTFLLNFTTALNIKSKRAIMATIVHPEIRENPARPIYMCDKCKNEFPSGRCLILHRLRNRVCGTKRDADINTIVPSRVFNTDFVNIFGEHLFDMSEIDPRKAVIVQIVMQYPLDLYGQIKKYLWSIAPNPPTPEPFTEFEETIDGVAFSVSFDDLITDFIHRFSDDINILISKHSICRLTRIHTCDKYEIIIPISAR
ncbi:MAG: hypothetical protein M0R33_22320 [Methylomonas sp.]|uniref:hypothetical protein n=1 Tax=Methylomonas sp. TaxID=418 RepID=UPI0025DE5ACB|nr:hypothetical protein [Methylomonas sp.]MCK9609180.1 hypothetical protein [Methylomonas sp.]